MQTLNFLNTPMLSPDRTMEIVLDAIYKIVPYELAVVLSLEKDNILRVRRAKGSLRTPRLDDYTLSLDERPELAEVIEAGEVHLFEYDPEKGHTHRDTYDEILDLPEGHSCMVAPLHVEGKLLGVLTLDHTACHAFTPDVVRTIAILSRIIALALAQSMAANQLLSEREALLHERNTLLSDLPNTIDGLVGQSANWLEILEKVRMVAPTNTPVLVYGETGTGKEQIARALHALSDRTHRSFVALNCSALVSTLAESELFGHERGSFTGAVARRRGRFELADNGTLFLDEIADLPLDIQPKLLRALQEQTFERVGGEVSIKADVRVVCASHVDLEKAVREGRFREDLYYRLNVFPIHVPPLRERGHDVLILANHFLGGLASRFNKPRLALSDSASEYLLSRRWPGNVRELQNALERAVILCQGEVIDVAHLEQKRKRRARETKSGNGSVSTSSIVSLEQAIRQHILRALELSEGRIYGPRGAAAMLRLKPTTLQSKMQKLGIAGKQFKKRNP